MSGTLQQLLQQALQQHQAGHMEVAAALYRDVLARDPEQPDALHLLGLVRCQLGDSSEGIGLLKQAVRRQPGVPGFHYNLGNALLEQRDYLGAEQAFRDTLRLQPGNHQASGNLALVLESTNQLEQAREIASKALETAPGDPLLTITLAKVERRDGRLDTAAARLEQLAPGSLSADLRQSRAAELARLYDRTGRPREAFAQMTLSNRLTAELSPVPDLERETYRAKLQALEDGFTPEWVATWRRPETEPAPIAGRPAPIFLIGFPRSGTTLLEQMLDSHPALRCLEESAAAEAVVSGLAALPGGYPGALADLDPGAAEGLRAAYFAVADRHLSLAPGERLIDKLPLNIVEAAALHRVFPEARFILALRHPCDVCLSCFMQDFKLTAAMAHFLHIEATAGLYDRVMSLWQGYVALLPIRYHAIRYEDLVADREPELAALLEFLEVDWDPAVLDHVGHAKTKDKINTPSYHQVTEPIYDRAKYRWLRYREDLAPILPLLARWAGTFGYEDIR